MSKTKKELTVKVNSSPVEMVEQSSGISTLIPNQGIELMKAMNQPIDAWAIMEREGPKKKMLKYIPHGYVRLLLNQVFGPFWSHETIEISPGKRYDTVEYMGEKFNSKLGFAEEIVMREVIVMVRLTVRVYSSDGRLISEEHRTGTGGKVIEKNVPFASAVQSAESDGLKRAAFSLGRKFGLELYFDDEELRAEWQEKLNPKPPKTFSQLIDRLTKEDISPEQWEETTGVGLDNIEPTDDIETLWNLYISSVQIIKESDA